MVPPTPLSTPQPSTKDYRIGPMVGEGSFGQIFYCQHKSTKREVAIKVVEQVTCQKHPYVIQGLQQERKLLQDLKSSPYIVNLWASFLDTQCVYLVLELATGGDLQNFIDTYSFSSSSSSSGLRKEAWKASVPYYIKQLLEAIEFIHSKGIIHSDLKPSNILCHTDGKLCLTDFACAFKLIDDDKDTGDKAISVSSSSSSPSSGSKRNIDIPRGTSHYACPELVRYSSTLALTIGVDLWSVGCIIYCLYVGKSPFEKESEALTIQAVIDYCGSYNDGKQGRCFEDGYAECNQWETFIRGLLHPDPSKRIVTMEDQSISTTLLSEKNVPKKPLLLPKAPWRQEIEESTLKDGALGWGVFML